MAALDGTDFGPAELRRIRSSDTPGGRLRFLVDADTPGWTRRAHPGDRADRGTCAFRIAGWAAIGCSARGFASP
jgi:hypothetical protein